MIRRHQSVIQKPALPGPCIQKIAGVGEIVLIVGPDHLVSAPALFRISGIRRISPVQHAVSPCVIIGPGPEYPLIFRNPLFLIQKYIFKHPGPPVNIRVQAALIRHLVDGAAGCDLLLCQISFMEMQKDPLGPGHARLHHHRILPFRHQGDLQAVPVCRCPFGEILLGLPYGGGNSCRPAASAAKERSEKHLSEMFVCRIHHQVGICQHRHRLSRLADLKAGPVIGDAGHGPHLVRFAFCTGIFPGLRYLPA